jgi:antitoxin CptB
MTARLRKLKYRAWHRGFSEADLILGPFADSCLEALDEAELDAFERLLEAPDHDLYAWIIGQAEPPPAMDLPVLARIRQFRLVAREARRDLGA